MDAAGRASHSRSPVPSGHSGKGEAGEKTRGKPGGEGLTRSIARRDTSTEALVTARRPQENKGTPTSAGLYEQWTSVMHRDRPAAARDLTGGDGVEKGSVGTPRRPGCRRRRRTRGEEGRGRSGPPFRHEHEQTRLCAASPKRVSDEMGKGLGGLQSGQRIQEGKAGVGMEVQPWPGDPGPPGWGGQGRPPVVPVSRPVTPLGPQLTTSWPRTQV